MKTLYDWKHAPEGATHAATDSTGDAWWYSAEPKLTGKGGWYAYGGPLLSVAPKLVLRRVDWQYSLEARPE